MKTLILKASPKQDGNTATMADEFARGVRDVGFNDIVEFKLNDLDIRPCQACAACLKTPYDGCILEDDFMTIFPHFRESDVIVFAAPIYWWHVCAQLKTFIDRMHPMLTYDREHCLTTKHLVFLAAHFAQDPYGVELTVKTFQSIAGWAGMGFDAICYHSPKGPVQEHPEKLAQIYQLGRLFEEWQKPELTIPCPIEGCGFRFPHAERLALHLVMAAGESHLDWKSKNLSEVHTLENTQRLKNEILDQLPRMMEDIGH
jgi:multimeric flavodoxin WrbA